MADHHRVGHPVVGLAEDRDRTPRPHGFVVRPAQVGARAPRLLSTRAHGACEQSVEATRPSHATRQPRRVVRRPSLPGKRPRALGPD